MENEGGGNSSYLEKAKNISQAAALLIPGGNIASKVADIQRLLTFIIDIITSSTEVQKKKINSEINFLDLKHAHKKEIQFISNEHERNILSMKLVHEKEILNLKHLHDKALQTEKLNKLPSNMNNNIEKSNKKKGCFFKSLL